MLVLGVASVAVGLRASRPWPPVDEAHVLAIRAQFGAWCCLMLLASPLLWTHYLPLVYWPLALVADHAERFDRVHKRACWGCLVALGGWLVCALLLAWPAARAAGAQLWSVAILWVVMLTLAARSRGTLVQA
jgi:hypothetical protein